VSAVDLECPLLASRTWRALGTTATVVVRGGRDESADRARELLARELAAIDLACSRFRADSELERVHAAAGRPVRVSALLFEAIEVAVHAARRTGGAVDPTVGNAIAALGYDADFDHVVSRPMGPSPALGSVAGYAHVHLDARRRAVRVPRGVRLDLGCTAKALAADRAAARIEADLGTGVLVSLGGDVAVAGPPPEGGWAVGIALESSTPADRVDQVVAIDHGGLASSATGVRQWSLGGRPVHHIVDPATADSAAPYWVLATATGASCVDANVVTTAAIVWGARAVERLAPLGHAVRLVRADGGVTYVNGWPEEG
jgi:thiamine biosynthesis lipoprotein